MYEPIDKEFVEGVNNSTTTANQSKRPSDLNENEDRDHFVDEFLTKYLGSEKQKEKNFLREKIKHKRQQIELSSKHVRKDRETRAKHQKKKNSNANNMVLSCKLKKNLGLFKLNKNEKLEYEKYEPIHKLWKSYIISCLMTCLPDKLNKDGNNLNEEAVLSCLKQVDYHGSKLKVVRSSNSRHQIGIEGIVLQDRKNVFYLLTRENEIKIIPKQGNLFEVEIFDCKFTLVGSNMCFKPEIRATKHAKIKTKENIK